LLCFFAAGFLPPAPAFLAVFGFEDLAADFFFLSLSAEAFLSVEELAFFFSSFFYDFTLGDLDLSVTKFNFLIPV
jgi:hypothetical protein